MDESITKSTSGQVHYWVHKWTSSFYRDALKLLSPQVDKFIIKSTRGRIYYLVHKWISSLLGPQVDELIIRSSNRTSSLSLQVDKSIIGSISGQVHK